VATQAYLYRYVRFGLSL